MNKTRSLLIFISSLLVLAGTAACGQQPEQAQVALSMPTTTIPVVATVPLPIGTPEGYANVPPPIISVEPPQNTATAAVEATAVAERIATSEAYGPQWQTTIAIAEATLVVQAPTLTAEAIHRYEVLHPEPESPRVEMNKPYPFRLHTHCGVDYHTDFDGSFWDAADKSYWPPSIGNPIQLGTMTLISDSQARFDYEGGTVLFVRHVGPKVLPGFCA